MNLNQSFKTLVSLATIPGAIAFLGMPTQVLAQSGNPPEVIINEPGSPTSNRAERNEDSRFSCELVNGEYTVMYYPESRPNEGYAWAIPTAMGNGWSPQKRCNTITNRFESYREDGLLELTTGERNGYDTICVTTERDPRDCRMVLTVPPGQDPQLTRDLIFDNLLVADDGGSTQGVYTFGDSQAGGDILGEIGKVINGGNVGNTRVNPPRKSSPENINLKPFLDPADGGTGQKLRKTAAAPQPRNSERKPDLFK